MLREPVGDDARILALNKKLSVLAALAVFTKNVPLTLGLFAVGVAEAPEAKLG